VELLNLLFLSLSLLGIGEQLGAPLGEFVSRCQGSVDSHQRAPTASDALGQLAGIGWLGLGTPNSMWSWLDKNCIDEL
jgi:hypothetical protein